MTDNKKEQERNELHRTIWAIADEMRGSVDGWDFKSYILGILFYRYISENITNYINRGEWESGNTGFDYADLKDSVAEDAREEMVGVKGFFILPSQLFFYVYGGPGNQQVTNSYGYSDYNWFRMLAQKGYVVACFDGRGTGGRGADWKKMTYRNLGHYECIDAIEAARWFGKKAWIDEEHIGIFGWSFGGYLSSLSILKGNDVFKSAIAVAPVTTWRYYDNIYTERFLQRPKDNPDGYDNNSPLNYADRLKGNYLLVHGTGDDNVHFQNALDMVTALEKAGKQFGFRVYPNKNHSIYGGNTRLNLYGLMTDFLLRKL